MKKGNLLKLINKLGIQAIDINDGWIRVSCPLADVNHMSKSDKNPSAGFLINDKGASVFHCFVCGNRSVESILNTFKWKKGVDLLGEYLQNEVSAEEELTFNEKSFVKEEPVSVPDKILNLFDYITDAREYLSKRGIDLDIAEKYGLLYCKHLEVASGKIWKNAIVFPVRDQDFKTYWIHFRSIDGKAFWHGKPEHFGLDLKWGRSDSFFGMEWLDLSKPVVLVEGAFDCLRLLTLGVNNVIATHGGISHRSKKLLRLINLNPISIICGFDADDAGKKFTRAVERLYHKEVRVLDWNLVGCKDAGELKTKQDLQTVLKQTNLKFRDKWEKNYV